jgi:hypothetical protein
VSDIDTVTVDSLKALDSNRPIREADIQEVIRVKQKDRLAAVSPKSDQVLIRRRLRRPRLLQGTKRFGQCPGCAGAPEIPPPRRMH